MGLSAKQWSFITHSDAFINFADGAVRSGKTHASLRRFGEYAGTAPSGDLAIFGKTERTVKRNVIYPMRDMFPKGAVRYVQGSGELFVWGRLCHVIGANNILAEEKVRGLTLAGGYMNEATLYPREVVEQAFARSLSVAGARWFGDMNPDSPFHYLYTDYLDAGHPKTHLKRWRFSLDDNPILPPENVEMLKALYGPGTLFYRRNIDGEWVQAEGAVYKGFGGEQIVDELPAGFSRVVVGVDYGTSNPTVFLALGQAGSTWYAFAEHRHDGRAEGQRTDAEHSEALRGWLRSLGVAPVSIELDPSAASFKVQLKRDRVRGVRDADNAVVDGIRVVYSALNSGRLKVHRSCEGLIKEMSTYAWDSQAQLKGEDKPLKTDDHGPDALRYACMRIFGRSPVRLVEKPAVA